MLRLNLVLMMRCEPIDRPLVLIIRLMTIGGFRICGQELIHGRGVSRLWRAHWIRFYIIGVIARCADPLICSHWVAVAHFANACRIRQCWWIQQKVIRRIIQSVKYYIIRRSVFFSTKCAYTDLRECQSLDQWLHDNLKFNRLWHCLWLSIYI